MASPVTSVSQPRLRTENPLDALLDELQTFAKPPSESGSRRSSADTAAITNARRNSTEISFISESNNSHIAGTNVTTTKANTLPRNAGLNPLVAVNIEIKEANKEQHESEESSTPSIDEKHTSGFGNTLGVGPGGSGVVRRLPSFPSSDSQPSPIKTPVKSFPSITSTQSTVAKRREERRSLDSISSLSGKASPAPPPRQDLFKLPPPPPPRTSSKSPTMSPSGSNNQTYFSTMPRASSMPPKGTVSVPGHVPLGVAVSNVGGILRNSEGRELYGPVLRQRPPLGRGSFSEDSSASTASTGSSTTSSGKAGQLSSNSSSTESVNSQEGITSGQSKSKDASKSQSKESSAAASKLRQEKLEQRHFELLRRQKQLQEQYQRLQTMQKTSGRITPVSIDLKQTGNDGNLASRLGLSLPPSTKSEQLIPTPATSSTNTITTITTTSSSTSEVFLSSRRNSGGVVETDIL